MHTYTSRLVQCIALSSHICGAPALFESIRTYKSRWLVRLIKCVKVSRFHICRQADVLSQNRLKATSDCIYQLLWSGTCCCAAGNNPHWFYFIFFFPMKQSYLLGEKKKKKMGCEVKVTGGIRCSVLSGRLSAAYKQPSVIVMTSYINLKYLT